MAYRRSAWSAILAALGPALGLFAYFGAWAFLKPPLQSPDEGHHLVRVLAVPAAPWFAPGERVAVAASAYSPLVASPVPAPLAVLFQRRDQHLDRAGLEALQSLAWPAPPPDAPPAAVFTQAWSYPAPYYLGVSALGMGATRLLGLDPYASLFACRLASVALAVPLWMWVWRRLGDARDLATWRPLLFVAMAGNPMLAFLTSSVTPDAVLAPLGALAVLSVVELATAGTRGRSALVILVLAALAKPAGLLLLAVLLVVVLASRVVPAWRPVHTIRAAALLATAAAAAVAVHYAWSPSRTYGAPFAVGPDGLAIARWLWRAWKSYWGTPGYLDYWLSGGWYLALTSLWALNAVVAVRGWLGGRDASRGTAPFAGAVAVAFAVAIAAGSIASVPGLGFGLQGRYLLPVAIGLAAVVAHGRPPLAWTWVACLAAFHVALAHETVVRYFGGDYALLLRSLPWQ